MHHYHLAEECSACASKLKKGDFFVLALFDRDTAHICESCWDKIPVAGQPLEHACLTVL